MFLRYTDGLNVFLSEMMKNAVVLGGSGYTGVEAVRLIQAHPKLNLVAVTGHSQAGRQYSDIYPQFGDADLLVQKWDDVDWSDVDVVFACLPHGASQETIAQIYDKVETVVDLSADFRLKDPELYAKTYDRPHSFSNLLETAVYGLTEYARAELKGAKLIACPGCYPTCSLLSLLPAIDADMIEVESLIIDAKSGITGAGRKEKMSLIYSELTDGAHAYSVGFHRHAPEIDQMLSHVSGEDVKVTFTPHLLPMNRGMITTTYATLKPGVTVDEVRAAYKDRYVDEPFVQVMLKGSVPQTRHVKGSNMCRIAICEDRVEGRVVIIAVIDNLVKGSSGQAMQNYNVSQGWHETLGLEQVALFP